MKKKILSVFLCAAVATSAHAGVKEKKAMRAGDEAIAAATEAMKSACGNTALEVSIDWDAYNAMVESNTDLIAKGSDKAEWVLGHGGERAANSLKALAKICADDADYKEEIATLTAVKFTPKAKYDDYQSEFKLDGTTLMVESGHRMSRSASDFVRKIMEIY